MHAIYEVLLADLTAACRAHYGPRLVREFSFCGDIDFLPTERYMREDAQRAIADARLVVDVAGRVIGRS